MDADLLDDIIELANVHAEDNDDLGVLATRILRRLEALKELSS